MLKITGTAALSPYRLQRLLEELQQTVPALSALSARYMHFVELEQALDTTQTQLLVPGSAGLRVLRRSDGKKDERFKPPEGDTYVSIESPKGEIGCYLVSDGSAQPYRVHFRPPSFVNISALNKMAKGMMISDLLSVPTSAAVSHRESRWPSVATATILSRLISSIRPLR